MNETKVNPGEAPPPYPVQSGPQPQVMVQPGQYPHPNYVTPQMGPAPGATFRYRSHPALVICQHCNATVTTALSHKTGLMTWAASGIICLAMGWLGCCLIPFCIDAAKDVIHSCPNCNKMVGMHKLIS